MAALVSKFDKLLCARIVPRQLVLVLQEKLVMLMRESPFLSYKMLCAIHTPQSVVLLFRGITAACVPKEKGENNVQ